MTAQRTAFPGILRYDALQAIGCQHCKSTLEVPRSLYLCPEQMYRLVEGYARKHLLCGVGVLWPNVPTESAFLMNRSGKIRFGTC